MTRPLRIEFAGALYHVTSRGDHGEAIYRDHADRMAWLDIFAIVCKRFNFVIHAYCQMTNHYHAVVETVEGNLSQGMRQLNGLYTQHFNRRHRLSGHLFQGRYKAILVQKQSYLLALSRYVVLNPLRAHLVQLPEEWVWSSHRYLMGMGDRPEWLDTEWLLGQFGSTRSLAIERYRQFVMDGVGLDSPLKRVCHQLMLGDESFVEHHRSCFGDASLRGVSKAHRRAAARSLDEYRLQFSDRDQAMANAYFSTVFTMERIGEFFGVSLRTVNRAVKKYDGKL
jgi:REP element-mobilizing transposase RayT